MAYGLFCAALGAVEAQAAESSSARSTPASYGELFAGLRALTGLEARFEEEKYLRLLVAPLRSRGRVYFLPPSTLLRRIEQPRREEVLIHESRIRISRGADIQTIDLAARREIRPLVDSLIWILTGDFASIEEFYRVDYRVSDIPEVSESETDARVQSRWQMTLTPKRAPLSSLLRELKVRGEGFAVDAFEMIETSGDRTLTNFYDADSNREFDSVEQLELFGIDQQ